MNYGYVGDNIDYINNLIEKKTLYLKTLEATLENLGNNGTDLNDKLMSYLNYKPYYQGLVTSEEVNLMKEEITKYLREDLVKKDLIREDAAEISSEITRLELVRNSMINKLLKYATLSTAEMIYLLEQFGINYRTINLSNKTLLVPEDFVLRKEKTIKGEDLDLMALDVLTDNKEYRVLPMFRVDNDALLGFNTLITSLVKAKQDKKGENIEENKLEKIVSLIKTKFGKESIKEEKDTLPQVLPFYIRNNEGKVVFNEEVLKYIAKDTLIEVLGNLTEEDLKVIYKLNKTSINNRISDIIPALEVYDFKGIPIYNRKGNSVGLNQEVLNILPEEVLSFLDYYIENKYINESLTLEDAIKIYKGEGLRR